MDKKYEFTGETKVINGTILKRIRALRDFSFVEAGEIGGWIEKEENLFHDGNCWVSGDAQIKENAFVNGDAYVYENACVDGNAYVGEDSCVKGNAYVSGDAFVCGNACIKGKAYVNGNAYIKGNALIKSDKDYTTIQGFGTEYRTTTFFRGKNGEILVTCGCFYGTIDQFRIQVKTTRIGKIADEYLMIADLMEKHFKED